MKRTDQQNKALHKGLELIANELNISGLDMRTVLKPEIAIPWTKQSVKEFIFKPVMKAMFQHKSTTELEKVKEIEEVWEVIMRFLMEKHHIEYINFPSEEDMKKSDLLEAMKLAEKENYQYPREYKEPTI